MNIQLLMGATQVGGSIELIKYPAACFLWNWGKTHGDRTLHESSRALKALSHWIATNPHLDDDKNLVSQPSLLGICLGVGILVNDARCTLFTEDDEYPEGTPDFIIHSIWTLPDYEKLREYIQRLHQYLLSNGEVQVYVN
jgi:hypothetical protein